MQTKCRGIVLAGGFGTRLHPMTKVTNKHLLPVYDKPMIYHPIDTLIKAGIKDIRILTGCEHAGDFIELLGDGQDFGARFTYKPQQGAGGIAAAIALNKDFVGNDPFVVILGDNIFLDDFSEEVKEYEKDHKHAVVFLKKVKNPKRFGVATIEDGYIKNIVEKPEVPKSDLAVTGLYFYNSSFWNVINLLKPSARGELEITDVNNWYIKNGCLKYKVLDGFWSDSGTIESLYYSSTEIRKHKLDKL